MVKSNYYRGALIPYIGKNINLSGNITGFRPGCGFYQGMYCIKPVFMNGKFLTHHIWFPNTSIVQEFAIQNFNGRIPDATKVIINGFVDEYQSVKKSENIGIKFVDGIYLAERKNNGT